MALVLGNGIASKLQGKLVSNLAWNFNTFVLEQEIMDGGKNNIVLATTAVYRAYRAQERAAYVSRQEINFYRRATLIELFAAEGKPQRPPLKVIACTDEVTAQRFLQSAPALEKGLVGVMKLHSVKRR